MFYSFQSRTRRVCPLLGLLLASFFLASTCAVAQQAVKPAPAPMVIAPAQTSAPLVALPLAPAAPAGVIPVPALEEPIVRVLLTPELESVALAQVVGRITTLNASLGSRVTADQLVVGMDCTENQARLKMSLAELQSARETYDSKLRLKGLEAAGELEVLLAAAAVSKADGQIEMNKAQIANCSITAPFAGRISKLHVKPHQGVNAGQPLFEIISDSTPRMRLNVPSKWLRAVRVGTKFAVNIDETGKSYAAAVSAINSKVDAVAQTIEIEAKFSGGSAGLLSGMSGTARFGNFK